MNNQKLTDNNKLIYNRIMKNKESIIKFEDPYEWSSDPVHEEDGKWYFWEETWADRNGPYDTEEIAKSELKRYCELML